MSFATPLAFALAAAAVPIVILYILKVRLRRLPVSTNLFWKQIYDEKPPRSIWQYLRHLLSLLAQLLLVVLLVLAVADPHLPWQLLQARRIVAVIDNSASMRTSDVSPSRFDAALAAALATADGLRFRDQMAIVLAGAEPEVVLGMSGHVPTLKRALRSIKVSDNPTELTSAIQLGQQLIGQHPQGQVLVFTDGCGERRKPSNAEVDSHRASSDASAATAIDGPDPAAVRYRLFGTKEAGNIGITQFQVRRSLIDPLGYEVLLAVKNASSQAAQGRLELELDGVPIDVLPMDLEPEGVFTRSLEKTSLEGGTLIAKLTEIRTSDDFVEPQRDGSESTVALNSLAVDDQAWAVLPARQIQDLLIVTAGNLFLQKVFEANPLVRVTVQKEFPETWPSSGIIVLHRDVPAALPPGDVLIVDPRNDCDSFELGELIENPIITEQDQDSPLMTHVRLDNVVMPEAKQLDFAQPPRALAGSISGDAVYAEVKRAGGKCLVLSVDIDKGDLAFRTAFPILVTNALGWFAGQTGELRQSMATGCTTEIGLAEADVRSVDQLLLRSPAGNLRPLPVRNRNFGNQPEADPYIATPPLFELGIWSIVNAGADEETAPLAELAINLASESETDLRAPIEHVGQESEMLVAGWFTRPIWFYLAASACLVTVGEWWMYQRRIIT